eukprot:Seg21912.1 transcript_id=Seg21912.1/GoldUCD/mRNA.D3Y31 product="Multidrug resistance protein MdtA" protein_id=Seg21912.1/GoldUCD/D3Y31
MMENKVEAEKSEAVEYTPSVEYIDASESNYVPYIYTQGEVEPATRTQLISEVSGIVKFVSPNLEKGGTVKEGELLVQIDDADYKTTLENAKAVLAEAQLALDMEEARKEQAIREWKKLGKGTPSKLVLREPQIASAKARVASALAAKEKADRDVKKTKIHAPYTALVENKLIEKHSYMPMTGRVADIYTSKDVEVRLPIKLEDLNLLPNKGEGLDVDLMTTIGGESYSWKGKVERFEGGVDRATFSMIMVVKVKENTKNKWFSLPPKGLFLDASLTCQELDGVVVLPRESLREGSTVWVLDADNKLAIRKVNVMMTDRTQVIINKGVKASDKIILSPIAIPVKGMKLQGNKISTDTKDR